MPSNRRTPSRGQVRPGSRGKAGPGRTSTGRPAVRPAGEAARRPERPRLTGRAAILVLVLVVLAISWASSFRAYFQQRQHINDLRAQIEQTDKNIEALEREKRRWNDDAYVKQQARERFGYRMPDERIYQVLDEDRNPLDSPDTLSDPGTLQEEPEAWWDTAWASVEEAGDPTDSEDVRTPVDEIEAPDDTEESGE